MAEPVKPKAKIGPYDRSTVIMILILIGILIGIIIAIPIVYSVGRTPDESLQNQFLNVSSAIQQNECTAPSKNTTTLMYLQDEAPFSFRLFYVMYRPGVIVQSVVILFGFRHDVSAWAIDQIEMNDTTTDEQLIKDGGFESNYLRLNYVPCILSNTRAATSDILFDNPYAGDFYYNDQTQVGMTYLSQEIAVTGGRWYNITFYLENRGYPTNAFILLIGY